MKKRLLLSFALILTSVMSWGQAVGSIVTSDDAAAAGFEFELVTADVSTNTYTARVHSVDVTKTVGGTDITVPGSFKMKEFGGGVWDVTVTNSGDNTADNYVTYESIYNGCTSIKFSEGLTTVETYAFENCPKLKKIEFPTTLTTWNGTYMAQGTQYQTVNYNATHHGANNAARAAKGTKFLAKYVIAEGNGTFKTNTEGTAILSKDGKCLYSILANTMDGDGTVTPLTTITVPDGVEKIYMNGFYVFPDNATSSSNLTPCVAEIHFPASLTLASWDGSDTYEDGRFYSNTFFGCMSVLAFSVDDANTNFCAVDGALYNKAKTTLIALPISHVCGPTADDNTYYTGKNEGLRENIADNTAQQILSVDDLLSTLTKYHTATIKIEW